MTAPTVRRSRVWKRRVVVGELLGDPHMVREAWLRHRATAAGLRFERRTGPRWGYFAVLRRAPQ